MSTLIEPPALTALRKLPMKWVLSGAVFVFILIMTGCYISGAINQAKQLGIAEEKERAALMSDFEATSLRKALNEERSTSEALRKQLSEQQEVITKAILLRNQQVDRKIAALQAIKPAAEVSRDLQDVGIVSTVQNNDLLFSAKQAQDIVGLSLDRDRLRDNLTDTKEQLRIEQEKTEKLTTDLTKAVDALVQANKVTEDYKAALEAYKKVVKPGIIKRIVTAGKYVAIGLGIGMGIGMRR